MKKIIIFLGVVILAYSCNTEQLNQQSDLASANLKGKVKKISRTAHETGESCGCVLKTDCSQSEYVYNEQGNLVAFYTIDENHVTNDSSFYKYSSRGTCSGIEKFRFNKSTGREVPVIKGGKITGYKSYNAEGELESTTSYTYNGNDLTEEKTVDKNGNLLILIQKVYVNGQLVSQTELDGTGKEKSISKYKRNSSNDVEECITLITKDNKEFRLTYEFEYDSTGNWTKQTQYYDGGIINIILRNIEYFNS
jgi:hypothetical protein